MKYELFGVVGTALVLLGFLSSSERKIRIFDMAGSALFVIYGFLIGSISNILLNGALIVIHMIKLQKLKKSGKR